MQSSEGLQQDDPLGPLLFCLSIHKLSAKLKSELAVFYLDDGTLDGNWEEVLSDLRLIEEEVSELGLELIRSKYGVHMFRPYYQEDCYLQLPGSLCGQHRAGGAPVVTSAGCLLSRCLCEWQDQVVGVDG